MVEKKHKFSDHHRAFLNRFKVACQSDDRILASFLGGSYAKGRADAFSDMDLTLITTDASFESFVADREAFIRRLGEPLFLEDFDLPDLVFLIFSDGTEAEIHFARPGRLGEIQSGVFQVLVDKKGLLAGKEFAPAKPNKGEQTEKLRRLIYWFWHEVSHFIVAMGRGQLWWARGQLDALRGICVNLARLRQNFLDEGVGEEPYFKVDEAVPTGELSALDNTFCPLERGAILLSAQRILEFYVDLAPRLAEAHGITYPGKLERVMSQRLKQLTTTRTRSE